MNISRFLALIGVLLIFLGGCTGDAVMSVYSVSPKNNKTKTGQSLQLTTTLYNEVEDVGCDPQIIDRDHPKRVETSEFSWSVNPESGATVNNQGVFKATQPGTYTVYIRKGAPSALVDFKPAQVVVEENQEGSTNENTDEKTKFYEDRPEGEPVKIFELTSLIIVKNGGTSPSFTMKQDHWITEITTYHWNDGKGAALGTIALKSADGKSYGPWQATGRDGQGGVKNANWVVEPKITLPAGTYTVIDSDPATHAQNSETGGKGITWVYGIPSK